MTLLFAAFALFAQGDPATPAPDLVKSLAPFALIAFVGYFIFILPMQRQQKQQRQLLSGMKVKDKVVTSGGIVGVIFAIPEKKDEEVKDEEVILKVDDNAGTRIRVLKSSIVRVYPAVSAEQAKAASSEKK